MRHDGGFAELLPPGLVLHHGTGCWEKQTGKKLAASDCVAVEKKKEKSFLEVYKKYYFWNDIHFNTEGHRVIAQKLIKEF